MNPVWRSQLLTIVRLELKRNFLRVRGLWVYLLAPAAGALLAIVGCVCVQERGCCLAPGKETCA